ncbi:DUF397 domain-containing protein [Streptomyces capillispiralis]|uniref:Uncharacterized protein DUF397 n=1 Tax=Streptomyces capillispiralis TaxID=68182 RepID=A0A561TI63_9ACTN|nr:DUF397 domain-containing protein [Streptomyces capillispiralis]TWF86817.1 uncharacterized protein DUF397 [Streptomyces capillispiralis]GHH90775.1 hypothetical protein GCM10017779_12320 [Streptomyces capillispiralis]
MTEVIGPFRKSSYSQAESNCVEVAETAVAGRAVRDSKQQDGPLLTVSRDSWRAFVRQFA